MLPSRPELHALSPAGWPMRWSTAAMLLCLAAAIVLIVTSNSKRKVAVKLTQALRPDVVLLDISLPGLNGLEVAARLAAFDPSIRVLILSMHSSEEYVLKALRVGVAGYLLKDAAVGELEVAIRAVARGDTRASRSRSACTAVTGPWKSIAMN